MVQLRSIGNQRGGIALLLILAIIIGALYGGYYYFQGTPRYALVQFKRAIVFKDAELAEKYLDMDNFISKFLGDIPTDADRQTVKKNLVYEINWPSPKSTLAGVKNWSVFTVPIQIDVEDDEIATTEPDMGTRVTLEKKGERQWIITSINFNRVQ